MPSKSPNDWLKKIFSVGSLSLIIAIIGTIIAYKSLMADAGGTLSAISTPEAQSIAEHPRTVIAYNDQSVPVLNDYMPELKNTSENTLRDFVLYFTFRGDGFSVEPTGFYDLKATPHSQTLTHSDERLGAGLSAQPPLQALTIDGDGRADIDVRVTASFSGASEPLHIDRRMRLLYLPRSATDTPDTWYRRVAAKTPNATVQAYWSESDSRRLGTELSDRRPGKSTPAVHESAKVTAPAQTSPDTQSATVNELKTKEKKDDSPGTFSVILFIVVGSILVYLVGIGLDGFFKALVMASKDKWGNFRYYFNKETVDWWDNPHTTWARIYSTACWYASWMGVLLIVALVILLIWIFLR